MLVLHYRSLHLSIIQSNPSLAIRLIELGQFTDQLDIQNDHLLTALHLAVITDQPHLVRALLLSGASLTVRDKQGNSPLHLACKYGHEQCVERLTAPPSAEEEQYLWQERLKKGLEPRAMNSMRSKDFDSLNYEGKPFYTRNLDKLFPSSLVIFSFNCQNI